MVSKFLFVRQLVVESEDWTLKWPGPLSKSSQVEARVALPQESCRRATLLRLSNAAESEYASRFRTVRKTLEKTNDLDDCIFLWQEVTRLRRRVAVLQRLFSMFPNGLPGAALLLLRLVAGALLITDGAIALRASPGLQTAITQSIPIGAGVLLALGLWTPIAGVLVALVELRLVFLGTAQIRTKIVLAAVGAALAALGPGVRSIDALFYGRKRFEIHDE